MSDIKKIYNTLMSNGVYAGRDPEQLDSVMRANPESKKWVEAKMKELEQPTKEGSATPSQTTTTAPKAQSTSTPKVQSTPTPKPQPTTQSAPPKTTINTTQQTAPSAPRANNEQPQNVTPSASNVSATPATNTTQPTTATTNVADANATDYSKTWLGTDGPSVVNPTKGLPTIGEMVDVANQTNTIAQPTASQNVDGGSAEKAMTKDSQGSYRDVLGETKSGKGWEFRSSDEVKIEYDLGVGDNTVESQIVQWAKEAPSTEDPKEPLYLTSLLNRDFNNESIEFLKKHNPELYKNFSNKQKWKAEDKKTSEYVGAMVDANLDYFKQFFPEGWSDDHIKAYIYDTKIFGKYDNHLLHYVKNDDYHAVGKYITSGILDIKRRFGENTHRYFMTHDNEQSDFLLNVALWAEKEYGFVKKTNIPEEFKQMLMRTLDEVTKADKDGVTLMDKYDEVEDEDGNKIKVSRGEIFVNKALAKLNTYIYILENIPNEEERIKHLDANWREEVFTDPWDPKQGVDEVAKANGYRLAQYNIANNPEKLNSASEHLAELREKANDDYRNSSNRDKFEFAFNAALDSRETGTPNAYDLFLMKTGYYNPIEQTKLAIRLREEAQDMAEDAKSDGSLSRFWEGLKAGATDADLWTGGLSSVADGFLIRDVMEKYNADKDNLTKEEEMLLDAFFTKLSVEAYTDRGIAYDVGRSIPESIGFMLSFLLSPTSGLAGGLTRKFAKWAIKKYGKGVIRSNATKFALGKGLAYGVGSAANAGVTSVTTGIGQTAKNISDESTPSYNPYRDKFEGGDEPLTAIAKGLYKTFNEVFVEEAGGSLLKSIFKPIDWGLGKISPTYNQSKELWEGFASGKGFKQFKAKTGFNGTPIEFGEEILTDIANLPISNDTFDADEQTGIFGTRRMVTTAFSCLAIGTLMNMPNAVTSKSESSRIKRNVEQSNALGGSVFSREKWNGIKSRIDNATPSEIEGVVMQEMMKGKLNTTQKKAILKYAGARVQQDALLLRENELAMEAKASKVIDAQGTLNDKTNEGYNATDENEQRRMAILAQQSEQEVKAMLGGNKPETMSALNTRYGVTTAEDLVAKVVNDESLTPEQRNAILNYINTDASKHAIEKRMADDANQQIAQATKEVTSRANADNPDVIVSAQTKVGDRQVTVIAGNVVTIEDETASEGGMIDKAKSSKSIVIQDVETGEKKMASVDDIFNVNTTSVTAQLDERVAQIKAEYDAKMKNITTGNRTFTPNQQITIPTQDGQGVQTATITNITPGKNGSPLITYTSDVDGTTSQVTIPKAEVEQKMDEVLLIGNTPSANEAPSAITAEPQINVPQAPVVEVEETKPIEVEDNVTFEVDGNQLQGVVASIEEGDGVAIVQTEDNKVHRVPLDNLATVEGTATKEQGDNNVEPTTDATSEGSSQGMLDNSNEEEQNAPIAPTESTPQAETPSESAPQGANDSKLPPLMGIPTDENGNKLYEQASVEATINDIYNDPDLDEKEVDAYVQARIDGATQRIADLETKKPIMGEDITGFKAEKAKWREQLEAQQASLDYWNGVQAQRAKAKSSETDDVIDEPNVPMMSAEESDEGNQLSQEEAQAKAEAERVAREKAREKAKEAGKRAEERARHRGDYRKAMSQWEDAPGSFFEYVAQALLIGDHKMRWNDVGATRGLGRHTTGRRGRNRRGDVVTQKNDEAKQLSWLIDDREGLSPEALADRLWNEYTGSYGEDMRDGSPLDVLLDVVTSMPTPQMMWEYVKGEHDARMEAEQGGYEEQYSEEEIEAFERDAMYREKYGVSEEEYWAQEALWDEFIESRDMSAEELENYDNFVAEQRIKEEYERRNQENAEDEQRSNNSESERGADVLSGTQSDNTRGNGDVAGESEGINGSSTQSNDVAQENAELDSLRKKTPGLKQEVVSAEAEAEARKGLEESYLRKNAEGKKKAKDDLLTALQGNTSLESVGATLSNIRGRKRRIGWRKRQTSAEARAEYRALKFLEKAYESRSRELHAMDRFGKALGVTVQVVDQVDGGKANAKIVGNKVLIAKDAQQGIKEALAHELLHRIKALSPEAYEAFAQAIEKVFANPIELANGRKTLTFEQMMVNMRMRYSSHRMDISIEGVREEVVADLAGMIMTDAELMERFVEETEGKEWYWQIWDTIKELLEVAKSVFRGQDHRNFVNAEKVLLEAMQMASEVQSNENEERKEEKEKYSLIGERGAIALDKAEEATIRMDNLEMARKMERFDYPTKSIRMATGWERGADGKWRYEIDDDFVFDINGNVDYGKRNPQLLNDYKRYKELLHKKNALAFEGKQLDAEEQVEFDDLAVIWKGTKLHNSTRLKDYIDHPELFEAYPELRDVSISFDNINARGEYDPSANEITLSNTLSPNEAKSTLIHEIQHAIQEIEGFARGGNVEASKNLIRERNNKALIWSFRKNISHMAKDNPGLSPLELIDKVLARRVELTGDNIATLEEQGAIPNEDGRIKAYNLWARGYDNEGYENAYNMVLGDDAFEVYRRHAGEVESRNVQSRIGMTPEQRRATLLAETEDVARKDQIFLMENSGVSAMASPFEYFTGSLVDLISIAKNAVKGLFKKIVTPVSSRLVGDLKELGIDISEEYKHVVDNYAIRHTFNNHGGKGEYLRGQIPINNSDFELIPDIVNNYDNITTIVTRKGLPGILYEKTFEDGTTVYVEEIHNKHKELTLVSMRKIKRPTLLGANRTNEPTPIPSSGKSSTDKGSDNIGDVQEDAKYSLRGNTPFYSNAEYAVENIKQGKATPEQWLAMIQKNGGLKAGEDKWLGLSDWLKASDAKTLTKEEVLEFIKTNQIVIEEVQYGGDSIASAQSEFDELTEELGSYDKAFEEMVNRYGDDFESAVWYDEVGQLHLEEGYEDYGDIIGEERGINNTRLNYTTPFLDNNKEIALVVPTVDPYNQSDEIHFGDAGGGRAVAWVRFGETTDENGNRVLVIDEIQSKRHQDGREKGYRSADASNQVEEAKRAVAEAEREFAEFRKSMQEKYDYNSLVQGGAEERREGRKAWRGKFTPGEMIKYGQLHDATIDARKALDEARRLQTLVPDAPFDKNWQELAMKRMLRYAAENGFDKVAWTTGAQQAERYDIGKVVDRVERDDDGVLVRTYNGDISIDFDENGKITSGQYAGNTLAEVFGKELATKIMSMESGEVFEEDGLRLGGEGMKGFYDKMLPSFMNKYGKKWGVKVGEVTMPNIGDSGLTMHSVDVTDAMRESVMEGQPMFREGDGEMNDAEVSMANDPIAKVMGKSQRSKKQQAKFAERERKYMRNRVAELAEKMHLDNVEVVESSQSTPSPQSGTPPKQGSGGELDNPNKTSKTTMSERKARAKGWFDTRTGRIVINISNHTSVADVERTLLHEAVAHYGLRQLFGKQFDTFLDNVYLHADAEVRAQIIELAKKHGWDFRTATEEYLAGLAEDTNFEALEHNWSWWQKIKQFFMDMLESIGWRYQGPELSDNELRYLLWRSYENMVNPGRHRSILGMAEDAVRRAKFGIGEYSVDAESMSQVAESGAVMVDNQGNPIDEDGKLIVEQVSSIDEITDADFDSPTRSIQLPSIPPKVDEAIGANGKPIVIKKNVFEKNKKSHKDLTPKDSRAILLNTLYSPDLYGQNQKITRPYNWILIHLADANTAVLVEVNENKDNVEIVNWHYINDDAIERKKKQAIREGGLILTLESAAADTSNFLPSADKGNNNNSEKQENNESNGSDGSTNAERDSNEGILFRDGDVTVDDLGERDRVIARETYERMVANGRYQFTEAMQDSMMGLKLLYKAILGKKMQVENIPDFENAYIAENLMSSQNAAMQQEYYIKYMKPLTKAIHALGGKKKAKRQAIIDYLMAKHGLERNQVMAKRDAKATADEAVKDITEEDKKKDKWQQVYNEALAENREKDYAGLTALTGTETVAEAEAKAQEMVENFETNHDSKAVDNLWERINGATKANLNRLRNGGVISNQQYNDTLDMYEYYIPLRGWDATTSDEVYAYLTSKNTGMQGSTMKGAKGRKSKADDPIATIGAMADSAIREANRNAMKQRFLNFVLNHPSDLVSVDSIWLQYDDVTNTWIPVFADIKAEDTPDVVEQKIQEFNEKMEQLRRENPGKYKHGKEAQNIPYVVKPGMEKEHQVMVKRNGQTYILTINGNPRAAQALNGLTNPDVDVEGVIGKLLKSAEWVNRQLSAFYTTRNPDFVVSNFARDMIYSNVMAIVKEPIGYSMRFHANCGVALSMLPKLIYKWEHGTLDMNNNLENMFYQFMINGGETGYTEIRDVEKHKRMIASELKKHKNVAKNAWHALGAVYDGWNRSIENIARFAAFKTSREMGRTVQRSAYDAKEISVNFNKKGSGAKMLDAIGQTTLGNFGAWLSGSGRLLWVFWNAGVQGATNFGKNVKRHPGMSLSMMTLMYALGVLLPMANDGDDEEKYYLLPEYVRRSNICFRVDDVWVTIPLPIEFRAMYGLGELYTAVTSGNEKLSDEELALAIAGQVSQTLPLDMLEGGGGLNAVIPSSVKPFIEAYRNVSWSGSPIHRDFYTIEEGKYNPQWTLAYPSTSSFLMNLTKTLNEWGGGDNNLPTKGEWWADWNPAKIEYILKGMFGGLYSTANKLYKTVETIKGDRKFESKNIPLWNRVVKDDDPEAKTRKINNAYYDAIDWSAEFEDKYKKTKKLSKGSVEYASKLDELMKSDEYKKFVYVNGYKEAISLIRKRLNYEGVEISAEELNERILALKKEMVEGMDTFNKKTTKEIEKENVGRELGIDESFKDVDKRKQAISDSIKIEEKKASGASGKELKEAQNRAKGRQKAIDTKLEKRRKEYTEGKKKDD